MQTLYTSGFSHCHPYRVLQKKQPSTGNHRDTLLTPATPNFNVVIGSAEHHQQRWLVFLKAAKHKIQKTTLNWGTGGAWPLWCGPGMAVFFEEPGISTSYFDSWKMNWYDGVPTVQAWCRGPAWRCRAGSGRNLNLFGRRLSDSAMRPVLCLRADPGAIKGFFGGLMVV